LIAIILIPFAIVNAGEKVVVMQFGKVQDGVLDEGIHHLSGLSQQLKSSVFERKKTVSILSLPLKIYQVYQHLPLSSR
jgi:regulator of protease activity HflC (stomatin/prohibitin superfamily)